ncbi:MAG: FtsW/RodA/SpoVE family cell cycle protein, partial [Lachnospiraceae bacterium]|nr:FtsW/RodA/SpoVE family cell cycle protein [Lachnospiraceae bacterium]
EELGVMGASLLILMFIYLLYRIFIIAQRAEDLFGRMLATGVFSHIALQVVLNIAVVTGAMPNTGVTLPFISYGGTATIFLLIEIGMVLNVQKWGERKREEDIRLEQFR